MFQNMSFNPVISIISSVIIFLRYAPYFGLKGMGKCTGMERTPQERMRQRVMHQDSLHNIRDSVILGVEVIFDSNHRSAMHTLP